MKYLILADIHSNLEALKTVLTEAKKFHYDRILVAGDLAGYGAQPNECIELLKEKNAICVLGNHDAAVIGLLELEKFNLPASQAIGWTKKVIKKENLDYLKQLPEFFSSNYLYCIHGNSDDPLQGFMDENGAQKALASVVEDLIVVGHNHVPFFVPERKQLVSIAGSKSINFSGKRMVVSLPAVGQPRDGNPKTGFSILDFEKHSLEIVRVPYDIQKTAEAILKAGLPKNEAERLFKGI